MVDTEKIEKVFDSVDSALVDALNEHGLNFEEIHVVLWRLNKKIEEQELQMYFKYFKEEGTSSVNDAKVETKEEEHNCKNCKDKETKEPEGSMYG